MDVVSRSVGNSSVVKIGFSGKSLFVRKTGICDTRTPQRRLGTFEEVPRLGMMYEIHELPKEMIIDQKRPGKPTRKLTILVACSLQNE